MIGLPEKFAFRAVFFSLKMKLGMLYKKKFY